MRYIHIMEQYSTLNEGNSGTFYSADEPGGHDAR